MVNLEIEDRSVEEFSAWLVRVAARSEALLAVYRTEPERFKPYREAVDHAEVRLHSAEMESLTQASRLAEYRLAIEKASDAGLLSPIEAKKLLTRHEFELSTPLVENAQHAWDVAWAAFWNILKVAERENLHKAEL